MALKSNGVIQVPDGLGAAGQVLKVNSTGTAGEWGSIATTDATKLPLAGGTMTGDISFGDNDKAIFGAGSDLQIYHDPFTFMNWMSSNSRFYLNSTGNVWLGGPNVVLGNGGASEYYVECIENGEVKLYYDNGIKLATTSTGIDVTGTVTSDQYLYINSPNGTQLQLRSEDAYTTLGAGNRNLNISANRTMFLDDAFVEVMRIQDGGNVGIGTDAPATLLHMASTGSPQLRIQDNDQTNDWATIGHNNGLTAISSRKDAASGSIAFRGINTNAEFMRIISNGNVGIGTATPATILDISTSGANGITLNEDTNNASLSGRIFLNNGTAGKAISIMNNGNNLAISTGATPGSGSGSEKVRILENGNVGIGTATPATALEVNGAILAKVHHEVFTVGTIASNIVSLDLNTGSSVVTVASPAANFSLAITNALNTGNTTTGLAIIVTQGSSPFIPNALTVNGSAVTINWLGGSAPAGTASKIEIFSFTVINTGGVFTALGSVSTFG